MQKRKPAPKVALPGMRVAVAKNFAGGSKYTLVEMQKTHAQAFGECTGLLFMEHKKFIMNAKIPNEIRKRANAMCSKLSYLLSIEAMNNFGSGIPRSESSKAVNFLKNGYRAAGRKKYADMLGTLEKWEAEIGQFNKEDVESVGFSPAHLQTLKLILLGKLKETLSTEYYEGYLRHMLPMMEKKARAIAMSTAPEVHMFGHN